MFESYLAQDYIEDDVNHLKQQRRTFSYLDSQSEMKAQRKHYQRYVKAFTAIIVYIEGTKPFLAPNELVDYVLAGFWSIENRVDYMDAGGGDYSVHNIDIYSRNDL